MSKADVPENISEEYYQISMPILSSFPKYRPPLDLFRFNEKICNLVPYSQKGDRLSNDQVEEIHALCDEGNIFVSRTDHPIYSQHIIKQLDLVLVDQNLKEGEVADICVKALEMRMNDFIEQPVKPVYDLLYTDLMVATEYLWNDLHRLKLFVRRVSLGDFTLARHSLNCLWLGLWLWANRKTEEKLTRKTFDRAAVALLLHDIGMSKLPSFILKKTTTLKPEEWEKIPHHPLIGYKILHKLDITFDEAKQATLEHHERLDGSGYPQKSKNISTFGQMVAVVDSFSAMIQKRSHATPKTPEEAARELSADKSHYDLYFSGQLLSAIVMGQINFKH